jgi:hypothetical protein
MGLLSELIAVRSAFLILDCVLACAFAYMTVRYVHWRRSEVSRARRWVRTRRGVFRPHG